MVGPARTRIRYFICVAFVLVVGVQSRTEVQPLGRKDAATAAIMRSAAARPNTHRGGDAGRIVPVYAYFGNAAGSENNADVAAKLAMTTAIMHKHIATLYASATTTGLLVASFTTGAASLALGGARLPQPNCFSHQQRQLTVSALAQVRHALRRRRRFIARANAHRLRPTPWLVCDDDDAPSNGLLCRCRREGNRPWRL